jgi:hypothetical protein
LKNKEVFEIFPNYFYYECLCYIGQAFELENINTKERKNFSVNDAERMLRNPNPEWQIPHDVPYNMNFVSGLQIVKISNLCK